MIPSTREIAYMVWLAQRTNTHGILKLKFQVPKIREFPDQTMNSQLKIRFLQQCWWRDKSQICRIPEDMDLQLSTHYQRNLHTKHSLSLWHHFPLPAPTPQHVGAAGWVGYINLANQNKEEAATESKGEVHTTTCYEATEGEAEYSANLPITTPLEGGGHFLPEWPSTNMQLRVVRKSKDLQN